jgi:hypothetical protein
VSARARRGRNAAGKLHQLAGLLRKPSGPMEALDGARDNFGGLPLVSAWWKSVPADLELPTILQRNFPRPFQLVLTLIKVAEHWPVFSSKRSMEEER